MARKPGDPLSGWRLDHFCGRGGRGGRNQVLGHELGTVKRQLQI